MKIQVISPDPKRTAQAVQMLNGMDLLEVQGSTAALHALPQAVNASMASLLVLDGVDASALGAVSRFTHEHPQVDTLVLSAEISPDFLLQAMQAGVREVLPATADAAALRAAVQRALHRRAPPAASSTTPAQVLSFLGCKGGNGTSVLAANLAYRLAGNGARRVALIDLDLQSGNSLLLLSDQRASSDVAEVARNVQRLDADLLRAAMVQVDETLFVLPAPEDIGQALEVKAAQVKAIVQQARQMFDFVVLDLGGRIDPLTLQALDLSAHIYAVLQLKLPQLRDARRLRALLNSLEVPPHKVHWIVNRYDRHGELPLQSLVQALDGTPVSTVPNHFDAVSTAVNQGQPIARNSPVARALDDMARTLLPQEAPRKEGWLAQLLGSR
ncbi:AAA family ATPase [Azohydromonas lata]|uniref:AAA family ATPase n=1 Tax=Azohydromonas lata TaxID=45677 RepID=UPI000835FDDA|nr:AAA family ATPase [Azohydromonas lata]